MISYYANNSYPGYLFCEFPKELAHLVFPVAMYLWCQIMSTIWWGAALGLFHTCTRGAKRDQRKTHQCASWSSLKLMTTVDNGPYHHRAGILCVQTLLPLPLSSRTTAHLLSPENSNFSPWLSPDRADTYLVSYVLCFLSFLYGEVVIAASQGQLQHWCIRAHPLLLSQGGNCPPIFSHHLVSISMSIHVL